MNNLNPKNNTIRTQLKKPLLVMFTFLVFVGCTLESQFSLPNNEPILTDILGKWSTSESDKDFVIITAKTKYRYTLEIPEDHKVFECFTKTINGTTIFNLMVKEEDKRVINLFYKIEIKNKLLSISEVSDKYKKSEFKSQKDLFNYFTTNMKRADFFTNTEHLKRK